MELIFPWVIYIGVPVLLFLAIFRFKKTFPYIEGKKVANTSIIEGTEIYKKIYKEYKILSKTAIISLFIAIAIGVIIMSRPAKIETLSPEIRNRDIFLCMDVSSSVDELNLDTCEKLKEVVQELDGERFGITIFNGKSVLLVPLTTDYDYVLETLDMLNKSFKESIAMSSPSYNFDLAIGSDKWEIYDYKYQGTLADEGSSFIGDGLASCLYNFPDMEENKERSRLIIFTTDNQLNGTPYVTVDEAAQLCRKNDVRVFAIAAEETTDEESFKRSIESTGGKFYKCTEFNVYDKLVEDIKKIKTSAMQTTETRISDQPKGLFVFMLICLGVYFVCSRKVRL